MYSHTFFVTSVRAIFFAPQIAQRLTELLGSEDTLPSLLHRKRLLLRRIAHVGLANAALLRRDLLQRRLGERRLLRRRGRRLGRHGGLRGGRHCD